MKIVNEFMLEDILLPLGGTADIDEGIDKYLRIQPDDENSVKTIIFEDIKPYYDKKPDDYKRSFKQALSYFLTTNSINFGLLYDRLLIAFDHPGEARDFFIWIWEVLFPNEDYTLRDLIDYKQVYDIDEPASYE